MKLKLICSIQAVEKYLRGATLSKLNQFEARQVCSALPIVNTVLKNVILHENNTIQKLANILMSMLKPVSTIPQKVQTVKPQLQFGCQIHRETGSDLTAVQITTKY